MYNKDIHFFLEAKFSEKDWYFRFVSFIFFIIVMPFNALAEDFDDEYENLFTYSDNGAVELTNNNKLLSDFGIIDENEIDYDTFIL